MSARIAARGLALALGMAAAAGPARAEIPSAEAYQLHCSGCHGPDGSGDGRIVPSLRELGPLVRVPGGREYLARVPGVAQAPLESPELAALLGWILQNLSGVTEFEPFGAGEIEALRRNPLRDPLSARPPVTSLRAQTAPTPTPE